MKQFAVLGAGVNGLTIGNILLDKWPGAKVSIYAEKTKDIVSFVASAQFYPIWLGDDLPKDYDATLKNWFIKSKAEFDARTGKHFGIQKLQNYELFETKTSPPDYFYDVLDGLKEHDDVALPAPYTYMYSFETLIIDTSIYVNRLMEEFIKKGGKIIEHSFRSIDDIKALDEAIIFNCLGLGAKNIFSDDKLHAVKGVVLLFDPIPEINCVMSTGDFILAPRQNDTYLGASYNPEFTSEEIQEDEIDFLFDNVKRIVETPGCEFSIPEDTLQKSNIIETRVGFRPVRSIGPRVEKENVADKTVIHNYGHGGNGIILSWGTGHHAVDLLGE